MASFVSATVSSGMEAIALFVAGSVTSKVFPEAAWTNWPLMKAASMKRDLSLSW